ncbi:nuclear transport factor 2 family protein [Caenispirillum salinarum]|uniref:nuclear transport factor 2 family protein n=1 Tax=Caenispirillum salinarum TaxID=859058 RepID=UPI0005B9828F|nr:nuclear transport factor 2 family protein [Caenispirillum salinarum]
MRTTQEEVRIAGFEAYANLLASLRPETLPEMRRVTAENVRFKDPFHDVQGRGAMLALLERTFQDVGDVTFTITHRCMAEQGDVGFLRWHMSGRLRKLGGRAWSADGMTEVHLDTQGMVTAHIDYWDAASGLYEMLPVIGPVLRFIRRRIAAF